MIGHSPAAATQPARANGRGLPWLALLIGLQLLVYGLISWLSWRFDHDGPLVAVTQASAERDGLAVFLARWEMNDLIFMVIEENLRPGRDPHRHPLLVVGGT